MSFKDYTKDKWDNLTPKDRQILTSVAINCASSVNQGSKISVKELCDYAEGILENFWQFPELQKPSFGSNPSVQKLSKSKTDNKSTPF